MGFETDGFFQSAEDVAKSPSQKLLQYGTFVYGPGDIKYKGLNGDNKLMVVNLTLNDHGDLKVIDNTQPRYIYNARVGGSWKNFDLDIFLQGVGKRKWWGIGNTILPSIRHSTFYMVTNWISGHPADMQDKMQNPGW
jgi:hypothetical protein